MSDAPLHVGDDIQAIFDDQRFVCWRWETRQGVKTKVPIVPGIGRMAETDNPATWRSYWEASTTLARGNVDGLGYCLKDRDGFAALDLDHCRDAVSGELEQWAIDLVRRCQSYCEITPSGEGVRILGIAHGVPDAHYQLSRGANGQRVEVFYRATRYITLTENQLDGTPRRLNDISAIMLELQAEKDSKKTGKSAANGSHPSGGLGDDTAELCRQITSGEVFHPALIPLAARMIGAGTLPGAVVNFLRSLMQQIPEAKRDDRWRARYADIPRIVETAEVKYRPDSKPPPPPSPFVLARASDLEGKPVPDRNWLVSDIIPASNVTLFSGDGGIGKSTLALQLAAAVASEQWGWIGRLTSHGNVITLLCEDDGDEVHRRLAAISGHMRCDLRDLWRLSYSVRVGADNLLMHFDRSHAGKVTPFYEQLGNAAVENQAALLILDSLHDFFAGDEINRAEARQFIGALRAICRKADCAVVLLGHPSLAGLANKTGTSGSTGWNNTVRSRCYLHKKEKDDEDDGDDDTRILEVMKSNYGPAAEAIELTWESGVFMPKAPIFDTFHEAEAAFLDCLDQVTREGRYVSDSRRSGEFYAPKVFARMARGKPFGEGRLYRAMQQLFDTGKICMGAWRSPTRQVRNAILRTAP